MSDMSWKILWFFISLQMIGFAAASPLVLDEEPIKLSQGQAWGRIKRAPILRIWYAPPQHWTELGKNNKESQDSLDSTKVKELKLKELKKLGLTIRKLQIWEILLMRRHSDQLEGQVTKTNKCHSPKIISHFILSVDQIEALDSEVESRIFPTKEPT